MLFKKLDSREEAKFRIYAEENDPPNPKHWSIYHPVCREVWEKRNLKPTGVK